MILDGFFDVLIRLWELLTFWRYPPPALPRMRLRPGQAEDNALMVRLLRFTHKRKCSSLCDVAGAGPVLHLGGLPSTDELVAAL